jgi:outer membrane protease
MKQNNKYFILALLFSCLPLQMFAQDFMLSLGLHGGIIHGLTQEYVYEGEKQISRLEWEENTVPYINSFISFAYKNFLLNGVIQSAVPVLAGEMRNHDYLLPSSNYITNYSEHEAFLERHNSYQLSFGYDFLMSNWQLTPSIGFTYLSRKWTASNGFMQYSDGLKPLTGNEPKGYFTGAVITYDQKISYFYAGLSAGYRLFDKLFLSLDFNFYPYIWTECKDHHILRHIEFLDMIPGGIGGSLGFIAGYKLPHTSNVELFTGFTFKKHFFTKGATAQRTTGTEEQQSFTPTNSHNSAYESNIWYFFIGIKYALQF